MFIKKTDEDIIQHALDVIVKNTPISNMYAGGIARTIVESFAKELGTKEDTNIYSLYDFAQDVLDMGFLSKAKEKYLDAIGALFNYPRRKETIINDQGEQIEQLISDDQYRYEISRRIEVVASSNYESLRMACLTTDGVRDIITMEYYQGTGSFAFLLIPQYGFNPQEVKQNVEQAISQSKALGVRPDVILPTPIPLEITLQPIFKETTQDQEQIKSEIKQNIHRYIGTLNAGDSFIYYDFVQEVMNTNENIIDFKILEFYLNEQPALLTNHTIMKDERIRPQRISVL